MSSCSILRNVLSLSISLNNIRSFTIIKLAVLTILTLVNAWFELCRNIFFKTVRKTKMHCAINITCDIIWGSTILFVLQPVLLICLIKVIKVLLYIIFVRILTIARIRWIWWLSRSSIASIYLFAYNAHWWKISISDWIYTGFTCFKFFKVSLKLLWASNQ
jgi:hypothetical protein